ncbi:MAG: phosphatidate cytidylyltransferase [Phycisphaerales bacterium]
MRQRLLFGPLLIAMLVGLLWLDGWLAARVMPEGLARLFGHADGVGNWPAGTIVLPIMLVLSIWGARELAAILKDEGVVASRRVLGLAAASGMLASSIVPAVLPGDVAAACVSTVAALVLAVSLLYYSKDRDPRGIITAAGGVMLGFVYLGLLFGFVLAIRRGHSPWVLLWILATTKACDIGAYFTGKAIGRHKLIPWLSPGKTWEGLGGGIALAAGAGAAGLWLLRENDGATLAIWHGLVVGAACAVVGQLGDLVMSLFKRDAGIKDSGHSLPGFGGILDVLDSPLLVAPIAFWWLKAHAGAI